MDGRIDLVLETQVKLVENVAEINQTLKFQAKQLEEHIRRTAILEERIVPVEDHVKFLNGLIKMIAFLSTSGGLILAALKLLGAL